MSNEQDPGDTRETDARAMTMALLEARAPGATVCPSEVARALAAAAAGDNMQSAEAEWRGAMPAVHASVDRLVSEGLIRLSWKGKALPERSGPYRIARGTRDNDA